MSEMLVIDTGAGLQPQEERIEPYRVINYSINRRSQVIPEVDADLYFYASIAKRLRMTLRLHGAFGLSAPQCGVLARMFVMSVGDQFITCINPKILSQSKTYSRQRDMDISYPGLFLSIDRATSIDVEYGDESGKIFKVQFDGLTSRIFQQNMDHLNGVTMTDHVGPAALMMARKKQSKLIKIATRKK